MNKEMSVPPSPNSIDFAEEIEKLRGNLKLIIKGKDEVIDLVITAFFAGGHILMEDVPGVGKTTVAKALALSVSGIFNRVQFTPDLLPADILGISIYNPKDAVFHFRKGPIFANILLADEINRASPRTQSALLEAMNESQATIEGKTYPLPSPFLVIATQNPIEYHGTYPLPEAQLDRFSMLLELGYPDEDHELEIISSRREKDPIDDLSAVLSIERVVEMRNAVKRVEIEESVARYIINLAKTSRTDPRIDLGTSPRASISLSHCAQSRAFIQGRDFVIPDDVKALAVPVLSHRIVLDNKSKYAGVTQVEVVKSILDTVKVPR